MLEMPVKVERSTPLLILSLYLLFFGFFDVVWPQLVLMVLMLDKLPLYYARFYGVLILYMGTLSYWASREGNPRLNSLLSTLQLLPAITMAVCVFLDNAPRAFLAFSLVHLVFFVWIREDTARQV